jgi:hypothetical protein
MMLPCDTCGGTGLVPAPAWVAETLAALSTTEPRTALEVADKTKRAIGGRPKNQHAHWRLKWMLARGLVTRCGKRGHAVLWLRKS